MNMNYIWKGVIIFCLFLLAAQTVIAKTQQPILYYGNGCPHCTIVEKFLKENEIKTEVVKKEVYQNSVNAEEFNNICDRHNIDLMNRGVPMLYANDECFFGDVEIIGYFQNIGSDNYVKEADDINKKESLVFHDISKRKLTIPLLIGAAIVDAINPCAFAVLLILMTTILAIQNRRRALYAGIAFSVSIFLSYLLMGLGLYSVVTHFVTTHIFMKVIGLIAILLGLLNIKDFFWYGKGFLMEVPMSWRNKLKSLVNSVANPIGAFFIGVVVSLFLLPCTSGPYIIITSMLGHSETFFHAFLLLILYNLIFILPMLLITIAVYFGMNVNKAETVRQKNLRRLHLVAGIIMLLMGIAILWYYV